MCAELVIGSILKVLKPHELMAVSLVAGRLDERPIFISSHALYTFFRYSSRAGAPNPVCWAMTRIALDLLGV